MNQQDENISSDNIDEVKELPPAAEIETETAADNAEITDSSEITDIEANESKETEDN